MSDDRFSLDKLLGNNGRPPPQQVPLVLPLSGLVCPRCGAEKHRLPDGNPSDAVMLKMDNIDHPARCVQCVQDTQMRRRVQEMLDDVPALEMLDDVPGLVSKEKGKEEKKDGSSSNG